MGLTRGLGAYFGSNITYHSKTNGQFGDYPQVQVPSYCLVNIRAGLKTADGRWRFGLFGDNVINRYYWTSVYQQSDAIVRYAGRPAIWGATVAYRFN